MKNKEKFAEEILDIACSGNSIAMIRESGRIAPCCSTLCVECYLIAINAKKK